MLHFILTFISFQHYKSNLKDIFVGLEFLCLSKYQHNKPNTEELLILGLPERFILGPAYLPERRPAPTVTRPESQHSPVLSLCVASSLSCTCCWSADRTRALQPLSGLIRLHGCHSFYSLWSHELWIRLLLK